MKSKLTTLISLLLSAAMLSVLSACSMNEPHRSNNHYAHDEVHRAGHLDRYGTVSDIRIVTVESRPSGAGIILGAVIGGVAGHQLGGGRGNDIATGVGAIGGAVAGNQIEKHTGKDNEIYRITIRFDSGRRQDFDYKDINGLQTGDRVKVEHGEIYQL